MDPNTKIIHYDRNHRLFQQRRELLRWAKEHESLSELKSKVITWEVKETATILQIPVVYHVHYHIRSIVGIDENENPIYGNHHICEISIPPTYPLQPCKIYFITDVWHPNVKADGKFKGKICGNTTNFGRSYDLFQLVLRIGEILQYKNYHAEHTPPFPEDARVGKWVTEFAEPKGIVNQNKGIYVDETNLLMTAQEIEQEEAAAKGKENTPSPEPADESKKAGSIGIVIKSQRQNPNPNQPPPGISFKKKEDE
ncbi:MAG: hypothetical protein IPH04_19485 [Saprospirales bacterium]|jgi:ubiquitin-protein ligase|nr:hypothetical protein [Saprospirales bacterium]MBK6904925.1 hypothetical protein [Saprospirales bacterium]